MITRTEIKIFICDIKAWWTAHQADRDAAVTFIHKYPMQVVSLLAILLCISLVHSCSQAVHRCDKCVSSALLQNLEQPAQPSQALRPAVMERYGFASQDVKHYAYAIGRPDGGIAFYVPLENVGVTELIDPPFVGKMSTIGTVYNDPNTLGTIVEIGGVRIGVKPHGRN